MFDMTITGELVFLNKKSNILNKFLEKNNNSPNNTEICKICLLYTSPSPET